MDKYGCIRGTGHGIINSPSVFTTRSRCENIENCMFPLIRFMLVHVNTNNGEFDSPFTTALRQICIKTAKVLVFNNPNELYNLNLDFALTFPIL